MSPFGVALMAINPFYTFILTMVPRILMGWLSGLIFMDYIRMIKQGLYHRSNKPILSFIKYHIFYDDSDIIVWKQ